MSLIRLTVALNSNRNTKTVLLVPSDASADPNAPDSIRAHVLKSAQTKLRLKLKKKNAAAAAAASSARFFAARTGDELLAADDWTRATVATTTTTGDAFILVSAGEDFVGNKKPSTASTTTNGHDGTAAAAAAATHNDDVDVDNNVTTNDNSASATITSLAHTAHVDPHSLAQLHTTAATLPGITHAVAQPDLHPGTKHPVGAAFVSRGWLHPPLIGGDIGCGMAWFRTRLARAHVDGERGGRKIAERLRGLEGAWRGARERRAWTRADDAAATAAGDGWDESLGTIGAGNHFAEIQVVERAMDDGGGGAGLNEGEVVLLVHSGSRGYGGDILKRYTADGRHESLREGEAAAARYLEEHDRACRWARANRELIALRFLAVLEPGEECWALGTSFDEDDDADQVDEGELERRVQRARERVQERKVVDIWHNNVQRVPWPLAVDAASASQLDAAAAAAALSLSDEKKEGDDSDQGADKPGQKQQQQQQYAYIHRKGAAPTLDPSSLAPLSLLPLPGSRATPTVMLKPTFSPRNADGVENIFSLAHGAGRAMSRAKALHSLSGKYRGDADALLKPGKVAAAAAAAAAAGRMVELQGGVEEEEEAMMVGRKDAEKGDGTWVVCEEKQLVWEEAPEAYKDVWAVAEDLVRAGAAEVRGWCAPRVSYKVRSK